MTAADSNLGTEYAPDLAVRRHALARVAVFWLGYLFVLLAASQVKGMVPLRFRDIVWGSISSVALIALSVVFARRDRHTANDIGVRPSIGSLGRLLLGIAIGLAIYGATAAVISLTLGPVEFIALPAEARSSALLAIASFLALSTMEELGFRGYPLRTLLATVGFWPSQLLVMLAFGLSHALFGWSFTAIFTGVLPSALVFGMAAIMSGGLALPIGLHAALNIASWAINTKDTVGIWTINVSAGTAVRIESIAPVINAAVMFVAWFVMWRVYRRKVRGKTGRRW